MENLRWVAAGAILLIEGVFLFSMILNRNSALRAILKDLSVQTDQEKPYSFARAQLFWWTLIICSCFAICYAITGNYVDVLNKSTLILLGLSAGTTATGRVIDNLEENDPTITRHQDTQKNKNFWIDILSDNSGVSVHRFQALIFNLLFGFIFIINFIGFGGAKLPDFGTFEMSLIGISSGAYLVLKFNENLRTDAGAKDLPQAPEASQPEEDLYAYEDILNQSTLG